MTLLDFASLVKDLELLPHPEGGFYRETHRSTITVRTEQGSQDKSALTTIYYLLKGSDFSSWHRIRSDESWFFHDGCDLSIYWFDGEGELRTEQLGTEAKNFQVTIRANTWFAAQPKKQDSFVLVSCAVAPGFDFADFEIATRENLLRQYGTSEQHALKIQALTRA